MANINPTLASTGFKSIVAGQGATLIDAATSITVNATAATTAALTYYVATTGLDTNDGLTVGTPFLTLQYALSLIPKNIGHNVTINMAAGTYTGPYDLTGYNIAPQVLFQIVGAMAAPTLTTGTTTGTVGTVTNFTTTGNIAHQFFQDLSQNWTVDELKGKWVSIAGSTTYRLCCTNTATTMTLTGQGTVTTGQTYSIIEPSVKLTASTSTLPTVNVQNNFTGTATILLTALWIEAVTSTQGAYIHQSGFSICRYCKITNSVSGRQTVQHKEGSLSLGTCYITATSAVSGSCLEIGNNGLADTCNIGGSVLVQTNAAQAAIMVASALAFLSGGVWVERLVISANQPLMVINACQKTTLAGGLGGLSFLGTSGSTAAALVVGSDSGGLSGGWAHSGYVGPVVIQNCGTAIQTKHGAKFDAAGPTIITNATAAFSVETGSVIKFSSVTGLAYSYVPTSVTNELTIDGVATTVAALPYSMGNGNGNPGLQIAQSNTSIPSTVATTNYYVSTVGSDINNDGLSSTFPYLTFAYNAKRIPKSINHNALVSLTAGTFAGANLSGFTGGAGGVGLYVHGTANQITPATGVATGTAGAGTSSTVLQKPTAAANWTASNLVGNFLRIISGGGAGPDVYNPVVRPIKSNTTTALVVDAVTGMDSTTVFEIVSPATILSAVDVTNDSCLNVSYNTAPITVRYLKFTGSVNYLAKILDNPSTNIVLEGSCG